VFKKWMAKDPSAFRDWIRDPTDNPKAYNNQMPALMRGSDANPMSLSQRQYYLLENWLERVRKEHE